MYCLLSLPLRSHSARLGKLQRPNQIAKFLDPAVPAFNAVKFDAFDKFSLPYTPMQKTEDAAQIPQANLK